MQVYVIQGDSGMFFYACLQLDSPTHIRALRWPPRCGERSCFGDGLSRNRRSDRIEYSQ